MGKIFLKNITLDDRQVDILIEDNLISKISPTSPDPAPEGAIIEYCRGKVALPAFINMHTHAAMTLFRGTGEDKVLEDWLDGIWAQEAKMDANFVYWGTKVACLEMMKTGTTTFNDQYWFSLQAHRAALEMGLRPVVSYVVLDRNDPSEAARQREQCQKMYEGSLRWPERSIFSMAFHAVYSVSEEMILWSSEFARKHGLKLHIHLSESRKEVADCKAAHGGLSPVEYLDRLGILDSDVIAAHTLWLSEHDVEILGSRGVNCVHNINSNTKLASGYRFLYKELSDAGANVCLGTDGCASSNNLDMLEVMKTSAIFQKAWRDDPTALPLKELISMATVNGAKALGIDAGVIREGALADLMIVNTDSTYFLSNGSFLANFIYAAHSDSIDSVICNGNFVMRNRHCLDEREILENAREAMKIISK